MSQTAVFHNHLTPDLHSIRNDLFCTPWTFLSSSVTFSILESVYHRIAKLHTCTEFVHNASFRLLWDKTTPSYHVELYCEIRRKMISLGSKTLTKKKSLVGLYSNFKLDFFFFFAFSCSLDYRKISYDYRIMSTISYLIHNLQKSTSSTQISKSELFLSISQYNVVFCLLVRSCTIPCA